MGTFVESDAEEQGPEMSTTYYDDPAVRVTSEFVEVQGQRFALAECAQIWHRRGSRSWGAVARRGALGAALAGPVVAAVLGLALAIWLRPSATVTVAIVGVSLLLGLAVGPIADFLLEYMDRSYVRGSRQLEIWARWRGREVQLLRTGDALRFGQIYRALQRAMENHRPAARR